MQTARGELWTLRAAALVSLLVGAALLLASWDGLYESLELPQPLPALMAQVGGVALAGLAWALWAGASRPESVAVVAPAGAIAMGGAAVAIAAWLSFETRPSPRTGWTRSAR